MYSQSDKRWNKVADMLDSLDKNIKDLNESNVILLHELILPNLDKKERSQAEKIFTYLEDSAKDLPNKVIASIIANMIIGALGLK